MGMIYNCQIITDWLVSGNC